MPLQRILVTESKLKPRFRPPEIYFLYINSYKNEYPIQQKYYLLNNQIV